MFESRVKTVTKSTTTQTTNISIDEYAGLNEEQIRKKLNKFPKKHLYQLVDNDCKYKSYSKEQLIELIYELHFVNTA